MADRHPALVFLVSRGNPVPRYTLRQAIYDLLAQCGEQAKLKDFSPHVLRCTFINHPLDKGADIAAVQKPAGHAQETTARCDRCGERAKRRAVSLLHVPYTQRKPDGV